jgi:hypothetical protein
MGANAQTSVPAFTAGQVLTAQQQTEINTGIPVFATTTTRDAAFGGTGEKTLAEGQFAYIEATNTTQYYDGAAWQTVGAGLNFITSTSGTAAASLIIDNCFTSTYENYRLIVVGKASTDVYCKIQFRVGGVAAATNYAYQTFTVNGTSTVAASASAQTGGHLFATNTDDTNASSIDLYKPNIAIATGYTAASLYNSGTISYNFVSGRHSTATAYDGFVIYPTTGTITASVYVYGYSK